MKRCVFEHGNDMVRFKSFFVLQRTLDYRRNDAEFPSTDDFIFTARYSGIKGRKLWLLGNLLISFDRNSFNG